MKQLNQSNLLEVSPKTIEGSFTLDLIKSKMWLSRILKKILKNKSAETIYILGSWYGNLILFLEQADIKFEHIVLVDTNIDHLKKSRAFFKKLYDQGKITLLHQPAEQLSYDKNSIVINCSSNEMSVNWLENIPRNTLVVIQGRNNASNVITSTDNLEDFDRLFPLSKTILLSEKMLEDPETDYTRFMKIGLK